MLPQLFAQANSYTTSSTGSAGGGLISFLLYAVLYVVVVAGMWKMFVKAGKPGWAAIIPIYNLVVLLQIADKPIWWIFGFLIPLVNIVVSVYLGIALALKFGKSELFGAIVCGVFGGIGYMILGYGSAKYVGSTASQPFQPPQSPQVPPTNTLPPTPPTVPQNPVQ